MAAKSARTSEEGNGRRVSWVSERQDVIVIGAGLGGLSAAAHLSQKGLDVTIVERGSEPGGRVGSIHKDGYSFDTGPTVMTMVDILESTFAAAGAEMNDFVDLQPLDPMYRACFADGSTIHVRAGAEAMREEIASACSPRDAARFDDFCDWLARLYDVEMSSFIDRNFDSVLDLAKPIGMAAQLVRLGAMRRLEGIVSRYFEDERLRRLFSFQAMYAGLAPHQAMGVYAVITYMDTVRGVYSSKGGMTSIASGLASAVEKAGVKIRYEAPVERITRSESGAVSGVRLAGGEILTAGVVVANPDLPVAYRELLDDAEPPRKAITGNYSPSALVWHVGTKGGVGKDVAHHNIHFGSAWRGAFESLFDKGERMQDPSILVTVPTVSDPSLAPEGSSVLYVLEPVPNLDGRVDWSRERDRAREQLAAKVSSLGYPLDIQAEELVDPLDWKRQGMERGTPFALSHQFFQSGPFRPNNIDKAIPGLVFVGSGTVPGVGIPMVLVSGKLAAERVMQARGRR